MRRIVVLGFGFGGYHATRALTEGLEGRRRVSLTVVADREHCVFTPLLPMVASGALDVTHVALWTATGECCTPPTGTFPLIIW